MTKEYRRNTDSILVSFAAGGGCDAYGYPAPHWSCHVAYTWSECKQAYWVYVLQLVAVGAAVEQISRETEMTSLQEVTHLLEHLKDLETCYQKVYGAY